MFWRIERLARAGAQFFRQFRSDISHRPKVTRILTQRDESKICPPWLESRFVHGGMIFMISESIDCSCFCLVKTWPPDDKKTIFAAMAHIFARPRAAPSGPMWSQAVPMRSVLRWTLDFPSLRGDKQYLYKCLLSTVACMVYASGLWNRDAIFSWKDKKESFLMPWDRQSPEEIRYLWVSPNLFSLVWNHGYSNTLQKACFVQDLMCSTLLLAWESLFCTDFVATHCLYSLRKIVL